MTISSMRVTCAECNHVFDAEVVTHAPIEVSIASMKSVRCPRCGSSNCGLGGEKAGAPSLDKPVMVRALWWAENGDVGISSLAIYNFCMGLPDRQDVDYPHDPADFQRCYRLLELIPEWREQFQKITFRHPWMAPFVEKWPAFEKVYLEEMTGKRAPRLYEMMRKARVEADKIRENG
jgi:hypothetical protein